MKKCLREVTSKEKKYKKSSKCRYFIKNLVNIEILCRLLIAKITPLYCQKKYKNDIVKAIINMTLGDNGILSIAKRAKENMELAQIEEGTRLNELYTQMGEDGTWGGLDYDAIAKLDEFKSIIAEAITKKGLETAPTDSAQTMAENIGKLGEGSEKPENPDNPNENGSTIKDLFDSTGEVEGLLHVGDYISYDPTKGVSDSNLLTYTSLASNTGSRNGYKDKTFTANNEMQWQILKMDSTSDDLIIISSEPVKADDDTILNFGNAGGYAYAEQELNEICKIYGYGLGADTAKVTEYEIGDAISELETGYIRGSGARSLSYKDILEITGHTPITGTSYAFTSYYPTLLTTSCASNSTKTISFKSNYETWMLTNYIKETGALYRTLCGGEDGVYKSSWISGRCYEYQYNSTSGRNVSFNLMYLAKGCGASSVCFANSTYITTKGFPGNSIRPIGYLKSNVSIEKDSTTGVWKMK